MNQTCSAFCAALLLAALLPPAAVSAAGPVDLPGRLDAVLDGPALRRGKISAQVVRLDDSAELFQRTADVALAPASNMKVLTAIAALAEFGPAHRFTTTICSDTGPDAHGAVGVLAVRAGGDPALTVEDWWRLAADLRRGGLREVRGGLRLDDRVFDAVRWHPSWKGVAARAYHSPVGGLSANYGTFALAVEAGRAAGDPARVALDPELAYLRLDNRLRTGPAKRAPALQFERRADGDVERITVAGTVPAGRPAEVYYRSVLEPAAYAGAVLRMQLEANGIRVTGPTRAGPVPQGWYEMLAFRGKSLAETVRLMMKYSNNGIAESLVKAMGARVFGSPGTWENGMEAMRQRLAALGLRTDAARLVDGSGLARESRVPARLLVDALRVARGSFAFGPEFVAALPIAATDGTLEHRAGKATGSVRAKSGLLNDVTGLSGYARMRDGTEAVFSILVNDHQKGAGEAMAAVDAFVAEIVAHDGARAAAER